MAFASLIFGRQKKHTAIGDHLIVDVTESVVTTQDATVTDNPVERGSDIADHVRTGHLSITIAGYISSTPTDEMRDLLSSIGAGVASGIGSALGAQSKIKGASTLGAGLGAVAGSMLGGGLGLFGRDGADDQTYAQKAMIKLLAAQRSQKPFTIQTFFFPSKGPENIYSDMVITQLSFPQTPAEGDGLKFTLTARRIEVVGLQIKGVSPDFIKGLQAGNSAPKTADLGGQATTAAPAKAADAAKEVSNQSFSKKLGGIFSNFFGGGN